MNKPIVRDILSLEGVRKTTRYRNIEVEYLDALTLSERRKENELHIDQRYHT